MIKIQKRHFLKMHQHVLEEWPKEACGLLAGKMYNDAPSLHIPIRNASENPEEEFVFDVDEQLKAYEGIDRVNLDPMAVYHSHTKPRAEAYPSARDRINATPGMHYIIFSDRDFRSYIAVGNKITLEVAFAEEEIVIF